MRVIHSGGSIAEHRGINRETLSYLVSVIDGMVKDGDYRHALAGCRYLCVHDDSNPGWWLLLGHVARSAHEYPLSAAALMSGLALAQLPRFCAELAKTYLAADLLGLASDAVEAGVQIVKCDGDLDKSEHILADLADEIRRRKKQKVAKPLDN